MRQLVPGLLLAAAMFTVVSVCATTLGVRGPSVAARLSWVAAGAGRRLVTSPAPSQISTGHRAHQDGAGTFLYVTLNTGIWDCKNSFLTWNTRTKQTRGCDTHSGKYEHGFYEVSNFLQPTPIIKTSHCTEESHLP